MKLTEIIKTVRANRQKNSIASRRYTRSKFGTFLIFVILTAAGLFSVLPLVYCICTAFKPLDELLIFPPRFFVRRPTIANFTVLPSLISSLKVPFSRYIFNSLFITLATTFIYILISMMAAFSLSKATFRGRNFIFWLIQFALMFNGVTLGVQQYLIFAKLRIIDTYWVYILPQLASTLGVFLAKQYIEGYIPNPLLEAAKIDGANYYRVFWSIVMPIIKPAWLTLLLFSFRDIWSMVPSGTIFSESLKTLPQIVGQITNGGTARAGSAMAVSVMMMIPPLIVYFISQSNVVEAMSSAGIKE